jgi:glycosyltransferase involved in cell wall biosynthesis
MLKVLWFTNAVLPEAAKPLGLPMCHKAGWLEGYLAALGSSSEVAVTVVTRSGAVSQASAAMVEGVRHVVLPATAIDVTTPPKEAVIAEYRELLQDVSPDLIHYHGSEFHYGLLTAKGHIDVPAVLSIQGIIAECERAYFGALSLRELLKAHTPREIYHRGGIWGGRQQFARRALVERDILRGMKHVIGRTLWDRAHVRKINPAAQYHHCDELLRPPFYAVSRNPEQFRRFSIYAPTASYPLKGFHFLLKAVSLLKHDFPGISVRVADIQHIHPRAQDGYFRLLHSMVQDLGLGEHIEWLGPLDAAGVAGVLANSHIFVAPSVIENLCNALAEAMLVGVPAIASYAGGMATTLRDGETGLCFPIGDHAMLAENIRLLFTDDELARRLAANARAVARTRHDYATVGANLVAIYRSIIDGSTPSCTQKAT